MYIKLLEVSRRTLIDTIWNKANVSTTAFNITEVPVITKENKGKNYALDVLVFSINNS